MNKQLSRDTINIIKNTGSLITNNDTKITARMFEILFKKYPHIEAIFINADVNQYMKLAEALSACAVNIDKLHILTPVFEHIAEIHVNLKIEKEHYVMVGISLIQAMEEVLGEELATPKFLDAWREAYQHISFVLIEMEEKMYTKRALQE